MGKIGKTEEFSHYIYPLKKKIHPFLDPNFKNLHCRGIFKVKFKFTYKKLIFPLKFLEENCKTEKFQAVFNGKTDEFRKTASTVTEEFEFSAMGFQTYEA